MNNTILNLEQIDVQIDLHLNNIPDYLIPPHFDKDDLRQQVYVALLEGYRHYDPALSSPQTFQDRVIQHCLRKHLSRFRWRKHRGEKTLTDCDGERLPVSNDVRCGELRQNERAVFQGELRAVIDSMPRDLKRCCELLMHYTPQEVCEKMKMPQVYLHRYMEKIRAIFLKRGVKSDYFDEI